MAKPNIGSIIAAVVDPMLSDNYQLAFGSVPSGGNTMPLLMLCQQATKPGMTIEPVDVVLFGHQIEFGGRLTYTHDLSVTYVENRLNQISNTLEDWAEMIRDHETQHGAYKAQYQTNARLTIFDQAGAVTAIYKIVNCWPSAVPEIQFDGTGANLITMQVTFKYDYVEREG
jgi:hypothetical protein